MLALQIAAGIVLAVLVLRFWKHSLVVVAIVAIFFVVVLVATLLYGENVNPILPIVCGGLFAVSFVRGVVGQLRKRGHWG